MTETKNNDYADETGLEIAIIGMAGRFPGANNIYEFWEMLEKGIEAITFFSNEELLDAGENPGRLNCQEYVKAFGWLDGKEFFDSAFFGFSPEEAGSLDPQFRLFFECAWEALENAGYTPGAGGASVGVYAGGSDNFTWRALRTLSETSTPPGAAPPVILNPGANTMMSSWTAHRLNLKGPAITVYNACSTSLAALHLACRGLLMGECDMALAGGVSIARIKKSGYVYEEGLILSSDGHCRAFDAAAQGTVYGEGVGVLLLKRLREAVSEGDHITAVIKGSAIFNDGAEKPSFAAPCEQGITNAVRAALKISGVSSESIGYVETQGTGTPLGDTIEVNALTRAFNTRKKKYCGIGSVKTNIGHLDAASGISGVIKTALALTYKLIPPHLHFNSPNPAIDFDNTPFYVPRHSQPWNRENSPLRAGVNGFGIGGTDVFIVMEEPPAIFTQSPQPGSLPQLILLSAKTEIALEQAARNLADHLVRFPTGRLTDTAYTLQVGRKVFRYRRFMICSGIDDAVSALDTPGKALSFHSQDDGGELVFAFPSGRSTDDDMGLHLYRTIPGFREEIDRCFTLLKHHFPDIDGGEYLCPFIDGEKKKELHSLPVFIFAYALVTLLTRWGIMPRLLTGEGAGIITAACIGGIFTLEEALQLLVLWERNPGTAMFGEKFKQIRVKENKINILSHVSGTMITAAEAEDPGYWEKALSGKNRVEEMPRHLVGNKGALILEIGPPDIWTAALTSHKNPDPDQRVLNLIPPRTEAPQTDAVYYLLERLGRLWLYGIKIDWRSFHQPAKPRRVPLTTYPFERRYYPLHIPAAAISAVEKVNPLIAGTTPIPTGNGKNMPGSVTEQDVCGLIAAVLNLDKINPGDELSRLSRDSLQIMRLGLEIFRVFNIRLKLTTLFEITTPAELTQRIREMMESTNGPLPTTRRFDSARISTEKFIPGNILLTGGTGFLGTHLLKRFLDKLDAKIYCLLRGESTDLIAEHLEKAFTFYFAQSCKPYLEKRLFLIRGDLNQANLGMASTDYLDLSQQVDTVIHCAADVRHYGKREHFFETNVKGTQRIIDFCLTGKAKRLHHISTSGVMGFKEENVDFKEWDLDIGQHFEGRLYEASKFEAEKLVHLAGNIGLKAAIYRVGNLTGRYADGTFQVNIEGNRLYNLIRAFIHLGQYPDPGRDWFLELSPVDQCGEAFFNLAMLKDAMGMTFHLVNPYPVKFKELVQFIHTYGFPLEPVHFNTFSANVCKEIEEQRSMKELGNIFFQLRAGNNTPGNSDFSDTIYTVHNEFTVEVLKKTGYSWNKIDYKYISRVLDQTIAVGFLTRKKAEIGGNNQ